MKRCDWCGGWQVIQEAERHPSTDPETREARAQAAVAEWNQSMVSPAPVFMHSLKPVAAWTVGPAEIVRDGEGRANAMVPLEGVLGLQPVELIHAKSVIRRAV
jgi:hypothetical protein